MQDEPLFVKFMKSNNWKTFKDMLDNMYNKMNLDFVEYIENEDLVEADNILFIGDKHKASSILDIRNYIYLKEDNFDEYYKECKKNGIDKTNKKYQGYVREFLSYFDLEVETYQDRINRMFLKDFEEDVKEEIGDKYIDTRKLVLPFDDEFIKCHANMKLIVVMNANKEIVKIYDNLTLCEKNIEKDLGISVCHSKISKAISLHKAYKGYFFVQYQVKGEQAKKRNSIKKLYNIIDSYTGNTIVILSNQEEVKKYLAEKLQRTFSIKTIRELTKTGESKLGIRIEAIDRGGKK